MGLLLLELVEFQGPSQIIVSEGISERRKLAKERGADFVIDPMPTDPQSPIQISVLLRSSPLLAI